MEWDVTVRDYERFKLSPAISDLLRSKYRTRAQLEYDDKKNEGRLTGIVIEGVGHIGVEIGYKSDLCRFGSPHGFLRPDNEKAYEFAQDLVEIIPDYHGLVLEVLSDKSNSSCG